METFAFVRCGDGTIYPIQSEQGKDEYTINHKSPVMSGANLLSWMNIYDAVLMSPQEVQEAIHTST